MGFDGTLPALGVLLQTLCGGRGPGIFDLVAGRGAGRDGPEEDEEEAEEELAAEADRAEGVTPLEATRESEVAAARLLA